MGCCGCRCTGNKSPSKYIDGPVKKEPQVITKVGELVFLASLYRILKFQIEILNFPMLERVELIMK
jgi:hypothetical protein